MWATPITLTGEHGSVMPLDHAHADALRAATADGDLHRLWYTTIPAPDDVTAEIDRRLAQQTAGSMVAFTVCEPSGRPIGMTTYMNIDAANRRLEIGSTWYARAMQRTPLNTQIKLLLLAHAFDTLDAIAVEFRTHVLNTQSRRAIERLGAEADGILRAHMIMPNGTLRDTAVYSITAPDWPTVRAHLTWQLEKPRG